jgi:hypothetical protein
MAKQKRVSDKLWLVKSEFTQDHRKMLVIACPKCGLEYRIRKTNFRDERECRACRFVAQNRASLGKHRGVGNLTRSFYNYFRHMATKRGIEWAVSIDYLWDLAKQQEMKCALTGLDIVFPTISNLAGGHTFDAATQQRMAKGFGNVAVASLDRLNSDLGYVPGNVQWLTKWANIMKNGLSQEEFVHLCHLVASRHANPEPSRLMGFPYGRDCRRKVQRLEGEETQPITPPRAPDTLTDHAEGDDIVRHSEETRRVPG